MAQLYLNKANEERLLSLLEMTELKTEDVLDRIEEMKNSVPAVGEGAEELKAKPVAVYSQVQIDTFRKLVESYKKGTRKFMVTYPDSGISKEVELEEAVEFFNFYDLYNRYNEGETFW